MTIRQQGGIFGRNPTFNEVGGTLTTGAQPNITSLGTQSSNLSFTSGKGIDFSATSGTGTSELFNDYEEGTWTPTNGANCTINSVTEAAYTKIGNMVFVQAYVTMTTTSTSFQITGLPHTSIGYGAGGIYFDSTNAYNGQAYTQTGGTTMNLTLPSTISSYGVMFWFNYKA